MDKYIYDENNGLWYERCGDYYLPCLTLPEQKIVDKWGEKYRAYLWKHKREGNAAECHGTTKGCRSDGMGQRYESCPQYRERNYIERFDLLLRYKRKRQIRR